MSSIGQGSISIDDSTRIGENAQDTANEVAGNVNDINSDNKLTPSEKLKLKQEYDKDVELYNIDIEQLKSVDLPTAGLETAMSNLTDFVTPLFKEMNRTSTVDRDTLDSVFTTFATADKNASQAFVNMVQQVADDAKKAGSDAKEAGEKAQEAGEEAKASANQAKTDATQAKADAATAQQKAQSSIDQLNEATTKFDGEITSAKKSAQQALDNITVVDSKVDKLSTSTTAQFNTLNNGYQEVISSKVSIADFNNLKVGSRNLYLNSKEIKDGYGTIGGVTVTVEPFDSDTNMWHIVAPQGNGEKVGIYLWDYGNGKLPNSSDWSFSADLKGIGKAGWFGVEAGNHNQTIGTVGSEWSRISQTGRFDNPQYKTIVMYFNTTDSPLDVYIKLPKLETGNMPTDWTPAPEDLASQTQITALNNLIDQKVSNNQYQSDKTQTAKDIASKVSSNDFESYKIQTADVISSKVESKDFNSYKQQTDQAIISKVESKDFQELQTQVDNSAVGTNLLLGTSDYSTNWEWNVTPSIDTSQKPAILHYPSTTLTSGASDIAQQNIGTILQPSTTYTASFYAKGSGNFIFYCYPGVSATVSSVNGVVAYSTAPDCHTTIPLTSSYVRYTITFTTSSSISGGKNFLLRQDYNSSDASFNTVEAYVYGMKLEKGNKATDWSPAPEDLATSTEFDQLSNAIKLKADSTDVTSQITVATKGIQSEVNNKVTDLNTKISQTSDAVQILNTTSGLRNLVYNSSYSNNAEGWNMFNQTGYLTYVASSSYNSSPGFAVNVSGMGASTWTEFGQSKNYTLPQPDTVATENTYSGRAMIKIVADSDSTAKLSATIAYYDKNGARIGWKDMLIDYTQNMVWTEVKFENLPVPKGAYSIGMQYCAYGPKVHGMIAQPMIVFGPKIGSYNPDAVSQSDITASINNIHMGIKGADGSTSTFNMNNNTVLLDANKIIFNGNTSIQNGTIGTAKIANAAINTAQIADGAINNAKIANAAINDAKISNLNGNKIVAGSITANKINVNDLIANGINTKTLTSVNLNTSTLTTPQLDLGLNGTFTEDFDYTQPTSMFLPKKNKGTLTFNHGVLQSKGNMQTYVGGKWGGMNDNYTFQAGIDNDQWTEVAPGYIKLDLFKQNDADVGQRTYIDPTGYYYTSRNGIASYLGNVLQTPQVQTSSVLTKYIGPSDGELRLQIGNNGNHYGLQVGSYAGNEAVLSDFIYSSTTSGAPNVNITANGHLVRSTSASKYKYNIKNPDIETTLGDRLLNVHLATWNDKRAVDLYAEQLSTGEGREKSSIDEYYGLIAEQLRDAGLDMFISYGKNHEIEGIQYDRAWVPLLSVIRRLNNKVNEYELRLSKLEGESK